MKITHYLYNAFVVEDGDKKLAIDPGGLFLYFFRMTALIPKSEWPGITHIFVTHGDPDHYWHADRLARASGAPMICNRTMARTVGGKRLLLGPRSRGLSFDAEFEDVRTISVGETLKIDGMTVTGTKATHGELVLKLGPFTKTVKPGPNERIGWGAIGFAIRIGERTVVNLGDTLLHAQEWKALREPDVLMIPIGGRVAHNTMDEIEALQAVSVIEPKLVIPCHYDCPGLFTKHYNPADAEYFKAEVERMGAKCALLSKGDSISV